MGLGIGPLHHGPIFSPIIGNCIELNMSDGVTLLICPPNNKYYSVNEILNEMKIQISNLP